MPKPSDEEQKTDVSADPFTHLAEQYKQRGDEHAAAYFEQVACDMSRLKERAAVSLENAQKKAQQRQLVQ